MQASHSLIRQCQCVIYPLSIASELSSAIAGSSPLASLSAIALNLASKFISPPAFKFGLKSGLKLGGLTKGKSNRDLSAVQRLASSLDIMSGNSSKAPMMVRVCLARVTAVYNPGLPNV